MEYAGAVDFVDLFTRLHTRYGIDRVTIQSGGELNAVLLRAGLIDRVQVVVAPCLIGGRTTSTLVDGNPLRTVTDVASIQPLRLRRSQPLEDSYLSLEYDVIASPLPGRGAP